MEPDIERLAVRLRTSAGFGRTTGGLSSLPQDLLEESARRVGIAALVVGGLWATGLLMNDLVYRAIAGQEPWAEAWNAVGRKIAITGLLVSIAMALVARRLHTRPKLVIELGLVYQVAMAAFLAFMMWWKPIMHGGRVSWVCVLILVYPSIAPSTLRNTFVASMLAASMEIGGYLLARSRGVLPADATGLQLHWTLMSPYICAFLAIIPMRVIRKLGQQVSRARELGSYRLEEPIGKGGMGEVYRASHRMLARPAAIKLIRPEILGGTNSASRNTIVERFRREADAAASLRSPHTIELYDFGVTGDGTFYYVMELLEGVDLETFVERYGPMPAERVVHVLHQSCASLAEAHARGLVHRDIKPSNISICRLGLEVDFVKVLDFGLVKKEGPSGDAALKLTTPDVTTGTPAYMAPEAALDHANVDRRADVYALGCVGYWLLTGKLVFQADSPVQILLEHVRSEPVPPSIRAGRSIQPELEALIVACLAKRPEDRPQDASELRRRLGSVPLREPWTPEKARTWWDQVKPEPRRAAGPTPAHATATIIGIEP